MKAKQGIPDDRTTMQPRPSSRRGDIILLLAMLLAVGGGLYWWYSQMPAPLEPQDILQPSASDSRVAAPVSPVGVEPPAVGAFDDKVLQGRLEEARAAVLRSPDDPAAWGALGMIFHNNLLNGQAATCYDQAASLDPRNGDWLYLSGLAVSIEDVDGAVDRLIRAIDVYQGTAMQPYVQIALVEMLLDAGRVDEAEAVLAQIDRSKLDEARVLHSVGQLALIRGKPEEARQAGERAIALRPGYPKTHGMLASAYQQLGMAEQANAQREKSSNAVAVWTDPVVERMKAASPGLAAVLDRARGLLTDRKGAEAIRLLEPAVRDHPGSPVAWFRIAEGYRLTNEDAKAEEALTRAVELAPRFVDALTHLGMLKVRGGKAAEGEALARRAITLEPNRFAGHLLLGASLHAQGRYDEAIAAYQAASQVSPGSAKPLVGIANALASKGDIPSAIEMARRASQVDPGDPGPGALLRQLSSALVGSPAPASAPLR